MVSRMYLELQAGSLRYMKEETSQVYKACTLSIYVRPLGSHGRAAWLGESRQKY